MEPTDYVVTITRTIGVSGKSSPDEAVKAALAGEGTPISGNYAVQPRAARPAPATTVPTVRGNVIQPAAPSRSV